MSPHITMINSEGGSLNKLRRGIPGVRSDAHHFGYFEDASGNRASPPKHSRFDPLIETLIIFAGILAVYMIFTFLCFVFREFIYSLKDKKKQSSRGSEWSNISATSLQQGTKSNEAMINDFQNPAYANLSRRPTKRRELEETLDDIESEVNQMIMSIDDVRNSPDNNSRETSSDADMVPSNSRNLKPVYSIQQLLAMKPVKYDDIPLSVFDTKCEENSVEDELRFSSEFTHIDFMSGRNAEKTIADIKRSIRNANIDKTTRLVNIYRLIVIAGNSIEKRNANVFLGQFNRFMDEFIDTGLIVRIINESNPYLTRSLIQMVLQYCYSHSKFHDDTPNNVIEQFISWKGNVHPKVQPRYVVLRYLLNLQLGLSTSHIDNGTLNLIQWKIKYLSRKVVSESGCNDLMEIIKLISMANKIAEADERKLFLGLLDLLVNAHAECCERVLFFMENLALTSLIKSGLSIDNHDGETKGYCEKIYTHALSRNEKIDNWWMDKEERAQTGFIPVYEKVLAKPSRPGSWKGPPNSC